MRTIDLKLKQASAVLGVTSKELQNLVQLKVISPPRIDSLYRFDRKLLLEAKVAFYLKESLGTTSTLLARLTAAAFKGFGKLGPQRPRDVWIRSLPNRGKEPVELKIPVRSLARELDEQIPAAALLADLPRGRRRSGWKEAFLDTLELSAADLKKTSNRQISKEIGQYRSARKMSPEITVVGTSRKKTA